MPRTAPGTLSWGPQARPLVVRAPGLPPILATFHPSYLLRLQDRPEGAEARRRFVADLRRAARFVPDESDS